MLIVVTGATGFIGTQVCAELLRNSEARIIALTTKQKIEIENDRINYVKYKLGDPIDSFIPKDQVDILIHLAWEGLSDFDSDLHLNQIDKHEKFLISMIKSGCKQIVVSGTCFEYSEPSGEISETDTISASSKYGSAKIELHNRLLDLASKLEFNLVWLRLFYVYGETQSGRTLIGSLLNSIYNNEKIFRIECKNTSLDYSELSELAMKICAISLIPNLSGIFNVASGKPTRIGDLVEKIANRLGSDISIIEKTSEPSISFWANTSKYNSLFKLPRTNLP